MRIRRALSRFSSKRHANHRANCHYASCSDARRGNVPRPLWVRTKPYGTVTCPARQRLFESRVRGLSVKLGSVAGMVTGKSATATIEALTG